MTASTLKHNNKSVLLQNTNKKDIWSQQEKYWLRSSHVPSMQTESSRDEYHAWEIEQLH